MPPRHHHHVPIFASSHPVTRGLWHRWEYLQFSNSKTERGTSLANWTDSNAYTPTVTVVDVCCRTSGFGLFSNIQFLASMLRYGLQRDRKVVIHAVACPTVATKGDDLCPRLLSNSWFCLFGKLSNLDLTPLTWWKHRPSLGSASRFPRYDFDVVKRELLRGIERVPPPYHRLGLFYLQAQSVGWLLSHLQPEIARRISALQDEQMASEDVALLQDRKCIGLHVRVGDSLLRDWKRPYIRSIDELMPIVEKFILRYNSSCVFLATDDLQTSARASAMYPHIHWIIPNRQRLSSSTLQNNDLEDLIESGAVDGGQILLEAMMDVSLLASSHALVGSLHSYLFVTALQLASLRYGNLLPFYSTAPPHLPDCRYPVTEACTKAVYKLFASYPPACRPVPGDNGTFFWR